MESPAVLEQVSLWRVDIQRGYKVGCASICHPPEQCQQSFGESRDEGAGVWVALGLANALSIAKTYSQIPSTCLGF